MKLCFDATRFGSGLDGAIDLASQRNISYVEYSFAPFLPGKANKSQDEKERAYFEGVRQKADQSGVRFAMINLDSAFDPLDKKAVKQFAPMVQKLAAVSTALGCPNLSFSVAPSSGNDWLDSLAEQYNQIRGLIDSDDLAFVLRLSTPPQFRGVTLKQWRPTEPAEWRALLSSCPGLTFAYSPGDLLWAGIDYLQNLSSFNQAISHVVAHDVEINRTLLQDGGMFGPLFWRYRLAGKGQVDWRQVVELLKLYDYQGMLSLQFDDEFVADDDLSLKDALEQGVSYFAPMLKG